MRRVASLPLGSGTRLHLLHVLGDGRHPGRQARREEALRRLAVEARRLSGARRGEAPDREIHIELLEGQPYVEIIRYARAAGADLIALGRKGAGARIGRVLGSTAARVLRMSGIPILVVGGQTRSAYERPLVALPLDPSARELVGLVRKLTGDPSKAIAAVRAYHVPFPGLISTGTRDAPSEHHRYYRDQAESAVAKIVAQLGRAGIRLNVALRPGDPCDAILDEAEAKRADLIALGTHARSGLSHALLGSVAETTLLSSRVDVLVARPVRFTFEPP